MSLGIVFLKDLYRFEYYEVDKQFCNIFKVFKKLKLKKINFKIIKIRF